MLLMETIDLRLDQIERVAPDWLADLYEDQGPLTRTRAYIKNGFARTFGDCRRTLSDSVRCGSRKNRTEPAGAQW
ncbi:hypothetical protein DIE15_14205 [Burkholderia sp. Bp9031]|uniref:hypothetical protein n=1 Tax=Burkholderia sp. Bp9031 TaxID=2184566 RepID=UPI000F5D7C78|nr:hypothetical protein [Burkholderia sp. Bp9031]RQZ16062.1 hypothetical protein DIE15_14205 [Burkholderia sp. Bp9031]